MYVKIIYFMTIIMFRSSYSKSYHNYTLYRAIPMNESQIKYLKGLIEFYDVNFWKDVGLPYSAVDFVVHPDDKRDLLQEARKNGLSLESVIDDVQKAFDRQTVKPYVRRRMNTMDWKNYYRLDDIYGWLTDLSEVYPNEVTLLTIGKSYENRDIMAVRVALKKKNFRSTVIVEGGIHAREWIGPSFVTYMISSILNAPSSGEESLKKVATAHEWYFIPVLNPDGYEYSHTNDRLWRKNRNPVPVDLNRNFDAAFEANDDKENWSDSYPGDKVFSEKESKALADFVRSKSEHLEYYFAFHSYGEFMIIPYGYSKQHLDNYDELFRMCSTAAKKIHERYQTSYLIGNPFETVGYMSPGVSGCWVKKTFSVPYVVTFELRDKGTEGFSLHPGKIQPTCEETLDGVMSLLTTGKKSNRKVRKDQISKSSQSYGVFDQIVIMFNVIFFIIVRFD